MAAGVTEPLYTRDILRLAASISGQRTFAEMGDAAVLRSATCGSRMAMRVTLDGEGRVANIVQAVEACAFGQAAAALMGNAAVGSGEDELRAAIGGIEAWLCGNDGAAASWPGLEVLEPARGRSGRHGAILLPFRALLAAIEDSR